MNTEVTDITPLDDLDTLLGPVEKTRGNVPEDDEPSEQSTLP